MARNNSLNVNRLSKYNFKFISLEEIILMEYLLGYFQKNNLDVVVPNRIELETGLKRGKITKASEDLQEKGFIEVKVENLRTNYKVNIDNIVNSLNKLFIKENKFAYQYFYFIQNPNGFKVKAKGKKGKKDTKNKAKAEPKSQMTLF